MGSNNRNLFGRAFAAVLLTVAVGTSAYADSGLLDATMSSLASDLGVVTAPTKKASAADVTDKMILNAVVASRTASFLLQTVINGAGTVTNGAFVPGELSPPNLAALPVDQITAKLGAYVGFLQAAQQKFAAAEVQLQAQRQNDPKSRDFSALAATLKDLGTVIGQAHDAFKPKKPGKEEGAEEEDASDEI